MTLPNGNESEIPQNIIADETLTESDTPNEIETPNEKTERNEIPVWAQAIQNSVSNLNDKVESWQDQMKNPASRSSGNRESQVIEVDDRTEPEIQLPNPPPNQPPLSDPTPAPQRRSGRIKIRL